jgi:hypothetical protein
MSNKTFLIVILALFLGAGGFFVIKQSSKPKEAILGVKHANQGQEHVTVGQKHINYNSEPASSGPHYSNAAAPAPWGAYSQELPPEVYVHNEEHGGIVTTYNPKLLSPVEVAKLQKLFTSPYSDSSFTPSKTIVIPRIEDTHAIELAAWTVTLNMDKYNEATLKKFYLQHVSQSPEATAGPSNTPIIQQGN